MYDSGESDLELGLGRSGVVVHTGLERVRVGSIVLLIPVLLKWRKWSSGSHVHVDFGPAILPGSTLDVKIFLLRASVFGQCIGAIEHCLINRKKASAGKHAN